METVAETVTQEKKYYMDYEDFQNEHPELDPNWREFIEPVVQGADDGLFAFVVGYLMM